MKTTLQFMPFALLFTASFLLSETETTSYASQTQASQTDQDNALEQRISAFQLENQTIADGVAHLNQTTSVAFAMEFPLGRTISEPAPTVVPLKAKVGPGTLANALDRLCDLDRTFAWSRIGNTLHIFPKALASDQTYVLNRKIEILRLAGVPDANDALFQGVAQLHGAKEQIAIMQSGISLTFSKPWTVSFADISVREFLDKIAEQLGRNYGWQFGGANDFRVVTFHERLSMKPPMVKPQKN